MIHGRSRTARFVLGYLAATSVATAAVLVVQIVQVLVAGLGLKALHDLGSTALIYFMYSLPFTLLLGLLGWGALRLLRTTRGLSFAIAGSVLGILAAGLWVRDGFTLENPFVYSFAVAGAAAAMTFRRVYFTPPLPSSGTTAAT